MSTPFWILLGGLALAVFWAIGAYNRLCALRDRVVQRYAEADRVLRARRKAVLAWVAVAEDAQAAVGDTASMGLVPMEPAPEGERPTLRWLPADPAGGGLAADALEEAVAPRPDADLVGLVMHACAQASAVGDETRRRPTRRGALASLNMAEQVLERTLRAFMDDPAATATPQALRRRAGWMACEVQLNVARQVLNREIAGYNAAVTQFPARLLATLVGMRPTVNLRAGAELSPTLARPHPASPRTPAVPEPQAAAASAMTAAAAGPMP